jgi:translation initiation factor IF-3
LGKIVVSRLNNDSVTKFRPILQLAVIEDNHTTYPPETPIPIKSPIIEKRRTRDLPQINERIRFPQIRVIGTDGEQLGILTPKEAQEIADENGLDLVLVSDKADPPVCRIMDYGKYKFELEKKAREAKKKQHTAEVKEVKMRYTIEEHDYQVRVSQADRFIKSGDKVKATITFRGREIQHSDLAEKVLKRMADDLKEIAEVQQYPKKEGRNMMMLLSPKKV